jgi:hypothetical protein
MLEVQEDWPEELVDPGKVGDHGQLVHGPPRRNVLLNLKIYVEDFFKSYQKLY